MTALTCAYLATRLTEKPAHTLTHLRGLLMKLDRMTAEDRQILALIDAEQARRATPKLERA